MTKLLLKKHSPYIIAVMASLLLSIVAILYRQPFDTDGIRYLSAAQAFLLHGFKAGLEIYPWPFYPILITVTAKITTLSFLHSAYLLNAILDTITVIAFLALIKELGGSTKTQWIGAFVLLTFPYFNHFRIHILRGHGYYPFALLTILLLIRFARNQQWRYALGWGVSLIIASLFRIEGMALMFFLPFALFFNPAMNFGEKTRSFLKAYIIPGLIIISIAILRFAPATNFFYNFSRLPELSVQGPHGLASLQQAFLSKLPVLQNNILFMGATNTEATLFLIGGLIAIFIMLLIKTFGALYGVLAAYTSKQKLISNNYIAKNIWVTALILNLIVVALFLGQNFYLSDRYIALFCLLLLLTIPFALQKIYANWQKHTPFRTKKWWLFLIITIWLFYIAMDGIGHFGPSKTYIIDSGRWIHKNIPTSAKLCCNNKQLLYYTNHRGTLLSTEKLLQPQNLQACEYIALKITRKTGKNLSKILSSLPLTLKATFQNKSRNKVLIFKKK